MCTVFVGLLKIKFILQSAARTRESITALIANNLIFSFADRQTGTKKPLNEAARQPLLRFRTYWRREKWQPARSLNTMGVHRISHHYGMISRDMIQKSSLCRSQRTISLSKNGRYTQVSPWTQDPSPSWCLSSVRTTP